MPWYRLKIAAIEGPYLKVAWGEERTHITSYRIGKQQFSDLAQECRNALADLANAHRTEPQPQYGALLRRLADVGASMYRHLFRATADEQYYADQMRELWEAEEPRPELTIAVDPEAQAPWGAIFQGDPAEVEESRGDVKAWSGFWALRCRLALIYLDMHYARFREARARDGFRAMSVFNREVYNEALRTLDGVRVTTLRRLLHYPVGPAYSTTECKVKWRNLANHDCFLPFLVHATGKEIKLADDDVISADKFDQLFQRQLRGIAQPCCLVFLNGCTSAVGSLDHGFLTATWRPGFCGFIGAEVEVPLRFAAEFGVDLLELLIERGASVQHAMDDLRMRHWPLSLLYTAYAHPDFRIEPSVDATQLEKAAG